MCKSEDISASIDLYPGAAFLQLLCEKPHSTPIVQIAGRRVLLPVIHAVHFPIPGGADPVPGHLQLYSKNYPSLQDNNVLSRVLVTEVVLPPGLGISAPSWAFLVVLLMWLYFDTHYEQEQEVSNMW
ncbi:hypothetical protein EYF80_010893 [Liparis tanakae]|uniref:Uncharacterized protein n=1 Tax=Liparis tanakae TaxID=230148 RepID=A0A4Z2IMH3_9TELE|nr:hypothetical protein EYF80_010893 [Liparis tanakae]